MKLPQYKYISLSNFGRYLSSESTQLQSSSSGEFSSHVTTAFNEDDEEKTEEEIIQMKIREDKMMIYANIDEGNPNKAYDLFFELLSKLDQYNKPYEERNDPSTEINQDQTKRKRKDKKIKPPKKKWALRSLKIPYALIEGYLQTKNPEYFPQIFSVLSWIQGHSHKNPPSSKIVHAILEGSIKMQRPLELLLTINLIHKYKIHAHKLWSSQLPMSYSRRVAISKVIPKSFDPSISIKLPPNFQVVEGKLVVINEEEMKKHKQAETLEDECDEKEFLLYEKQIKNETKCIEDRAMDYRSIVETVNNLGRSAALPASKKMILEWFEPLALLIKNEQELAMECDIYSSSPSTFSISSYAEQILSIDADRLAVITIHHILGMLLPQPTGIKYTQAALAIGEAVEEEYIQDQLKDLVTKSHLKRIQKQPRIIYDKIKRTYVENKWPTNSLVSLGGALINLLLESALVPLSTATLSSPSSSASSSTGQPEEIKERTKAFAHQYKYERNKTYGSIVMSEELLKQIDFVHSLQETFQPKLLPMVVPPMPWVSPHNGGYLRARTVVMRAYSKHQIQQLVTYSDDVREIYELLDILGSVPWKINKDIYHVMVEAWKRGGGLPYIPTKQNYKYPKIPDDYRSCAETRKLWRRERKKIAQMNAELHSLRCDLVLKLDTAKRVLDDERIYFPHNIDFRGRCYPIPPHLNHIGSDLARGLLLFADGKPLGEKGFKWLKIHLANVFGNNKISFDERVKFVDSHKEDIIESANNPLDGQRWWLQGEDHWQCLSTCMELARAWALPDPTKYVCNLPIHMDGSCNGLQHYAALGGDVEGGRSVNLIQAEKPQDVYTEVLKDVIRRVDIDAANGVPIAMKLQGKLTRKTIKQTVMTSVYGVTLIGARKQIENAMWDQSTVEEEDLFGASRYIAKVTFEALTNMFSGAREIMDWLKDSARTVARSNEVMKWKTPLKLPVLQHYRRPGKLTVKTQLQSVILVMDMDDLPVLIQKQRTAFPPNYVHSLDSTHMLYTTRLCHDAGITFAAVHDSFWTHACTVDTMNVLLREAFVKLHKTPLLDELRGQLSAQFPALKFKPIPVRGPLDVESVKTSPYFFH